MVGRLLRTSGRSIAWLCLLLSLFGCIGAQSQEKQSTAPVNGSAQNPVIVAMGLVDVEQGVTRLMIEMPGRIIRILVKENDPCEAGAALLAVDDTQAKLKLAQVKLALQVAEGKVTQAKTGLQIVEAEKQAQDVSIEVAEGRELAFKRRLADLKNVAEIPKTTVRELEDLYRDSTLLVKGEKAKLHVIETKLDYAKTDEAQAKLQMQVYQEQVKEAEKAVADCVLKAPFKGKVLRIRARSGELVVPGFQEPLIEYCPDSPRIVRAEISQEFAQAARVGQVCKITDDSRNNSGSWTGHIQRIGDWYSPRRSNLFEPLQMNDVRTLECIVTLEPGGEPLRIGQRMRISIETGNTSSRSHDAKVHEETTKK
jgi:multidrug resistance efflux pump